MSGWLSLRPEIAGRGDDAPAQMMLPEAIDDGASQQVACTLVGVRDPFGEGTTAVGGAPTGGGRRLPVLLTIGRPHQDRKKALGCDFPFVVRIAPIQEVGLLQEVAALRVGADGGNALAADHYFLDWRLRHDGEMLLYLLIKRLPA